MLRNSLDPDPDSDFWLDPDPDSMNMDPNTAFLWYLRDDPQLSTYNPGEDGRARVARSGALLPSGFRRRVPPYPLCASCRGFWSWPLLSHFWHRPVVHSTHWSPSMYRVGTGTTWIFNTWKRRKKCSHTALFVYILQSFNLSILLILGF